MQMNKTWRRGAAALALALGGAASAGATTLVRASLEDLAAGNDTIVVAEVLGASSYWNWEGTSILTDVRVAPTDVLKGRVDGHELTVTLMGGTVDDRSLVIVGGAELQPGRSYVLFLAQDDLPGVRAVQTVRDLSQGAFEVVQAEDGATRAVSQASRMPLKADRLGRADAPGGAAGLPLAELKESIRSAVKRGASPQEVKP
jgi:hypothetical protein